MDPTLDCHNLNEYQPGEDRDSNMAALSDQVEGNSYDLSLFMDRLFLQGDV